MAVLIQPHWETVTPQLRDVLQLVSRQVFAEHFYLAGGTALALQIGHRPSVDLDFFSERDELFDASRHAIIAALEQRAAVEVREDVIGNLLLKVNQLSVGFFSYGYPLLEAVSAAGLLRLASVADIGLMKMDALMMRGARKDFVDLYCLTQTVSFDRLLELRPRKYPRSSNFEIMLLEALTNFDNAERDVMPRLSVALDWERIKSSFEAEARRLATKWLE
jgi:predicted nucleotidyltransferase component of viral defense system